MITTIHLFHDGFAKAEILISDGVTATVQIPSEALQGKSMDERYALITEKANRLIQADNVVEAA